MHLYPGQVLKSQDGVPCPDALVPFQERGLKWFLPALLAVPFLLLLGAKSCLILCDPMDCNMPGFPVLHYLPEFAQTHDH